MKVPPIVKTRRACASETPSQLHSYSSDSSEGKEDLESRGIYHKRTLPPKRWYSKLVERLRCSEEPLSLAQPELNATIAAPRLDICSQPAKETAAWARHPDGLMNIANEGSNLSIAVTTC